MTNRTVFDLAEFPPRLPPALAETDIQLVAVYSGASFVFPEILDEELWRIEKAASLGSRLGAEHLVVGGGAQR